LFRKLISVDEAKKILAQNFNAKPVGKEFVLLSEAYNRVLATDVISPLDIPPFNRSTVDGFATKAADTFGAEENRPIALKLIGMVNIGEAPRIKVEKGTVAEIVTGAPIPEGADAVVMAEYTVRKDKTVLVNQSVSLNENVMKAGSDIRKGETVLKKNVVLSPSEIGALAAIGLAKLEVYKRPKVAIFSTGAEIVEPGKPLKEGKIFDINAHTLSAAVAECGGEPLNIGIVQDEPEQMKATLGKALTTADAIITSGGVSVGPTDIIPVVLDTLGKPGVIIYGIAIRPGKPTTIAVVNNKPVFSMPGHPTSSVLIFRLLARSAISLMAGRREEPALTISAMTSDRFFPSRGRRTYIMVTLKSDESGRIVASPVPTGLSGAITTLTKADGFIVIHENQQFIEKGQNVEVELFKADIYHSLIRGKKIN
jgi:putative molybdopterin biosynthesis protein